MKTKNVFRYAGFLFLLVQVMTFGTLVSVLFSYFAIICMTIALTFDWVDIQRWNKK